MSPSKLSTGTGKPLRSFIIYNGRVATKFIIMKKFLKFGSIVFVPVALVAVLWTQTGDLKAQVQPSVTVHFTQTPINTEELWIGVCRIRFASSTVSAVDSDCADDVAVLHIDNSGTVRTPTQMATALSGLTNVGSGILDLTSDLTVALVNSTSVLFAYPADVWGFLHVSNEIDGNIDWSVAGQEGRSINVSKIGSGSGTVTATGISCGSDCSEILADGSRVTFTATPNGGSSFNGWTGACVGMQGNTCSVNISDNLNITADFASATTGGGGDRRTPRTRATTTPPVITAPVPGCPPGMICTPSTGAANACIPQTIVTKKMPVPVDLLNLTVGSRGNKVLQLQRLLIQYKYLNAGYDTGYMGNLTLTALNRYKVAPLTSTTTIPCPTTVVQTPTFTAIPYGQVISAFTRVLKIGSTGEDVRELQKFLNSKGFKVSNSGAGSPGYESTYYGPATFAAVKRFQEAYAAEILRPLGLYVGTGTFGASTMKKVNLMR